MLEIICVEDSCWRLSALRLSGGGDSCVVLRVRLEIPVLSVMPWCRCCSKMCLHALENALIWSVATYQELWPISVEWYMLVSWYMLLVSWIYSNNLLWYNVCWYRDIIYRDIMYAVYCALELMDRRWSVEEYEIYICVEWWSCLNILIYFDIFWANPNFLSEAA